MTDANAYGAAIVIADLAALTRLARWYFVPRRGQHRRGGRS